MAQQDSGPIRQFIEAAKSGGASDEFLFRLLRDQGWPERQIFDAFREHYEARTGIPLPSRAAGAGAKDAFYLLLCFSTLATWAIAVGALLFTAIDAYFPDPLFRPYYGDSARYGVSQSLASAIVAFPVYLFVMSIITRDSRQHPAKLESGIRRWLTYIALLFAAGTVIGDVVTFLAYLLRGELTIRFTLKVLAVAVISGGIFSYYLSFAGKQLDAQTSDRRRNRLYGAAAGLVMALALVFGFLQLGSPKVQRASEADRQRVNDLQAIGRFLFQRKNLPDSLDALERSGIRIRDPLNNQPYVYLRKSDTEYELCAMFDGNTQTTPNRGDSAFWRHDSQLHCFPLDLNTSPAYAPN